MEQRIKLHDGNLMPVVGLGTWQLTGPGGIEAIKQALRFGYRLIDTAAMYQNEAEVGEAIRTSQVRREEVFLTTKILPSQTKVAAAVAQRLEQLKFDYVDLCLIHWPPTFGAGESLWAGLIEEQRAGRCRSIGVSNYSSRQITQIYMSSGKLPVVNQIEVSPFRMPKDLIAYCQSKNIAIQAYTPLTRQKRLDDPGLARMGQTYHKSTAQILLRWSFQKGLVPIPKATTHEHLQENIDIFDFEITSSDMQILDQLGEHS